MDIRHLVDKVLSCFKIPVLFLVGTNGLKKSVLIQRHLVFSEAVPKGCL